jgi:hypothetical protein
MVKDGAVVLSAKIVGGCCNVQLGSAPQGQSPSPSVPSAKRMSVVDTKLLYRAAGHPSSKALKKMFPSAILKSLACESCALSKSHQLLFPGSLPQAKKPLEFISMDLSRKISPSLIGGNNYYFKITNHFTQFCHVYILSSKSQAFRFVMKYYNKVTNHHTTTIKTVIFDGGGKFNSKEFLSFLSNKGITVQVTAPYTPQQNSVAERANRTTSEKARCLLKQAKLPSNYWAEAVTTAVFLENVTPLRKLKWKTPYQLWYRRQFNNDWLKPFGCLAFANIPKKLCSRKFGDTSKKGLLVGYQHGAHNWRVLLPAGKVERCHDVTFHVSDFPGVSIFAPFNPSSNFDLLAPCKFTKIKELTPDGYRAVSSPTPSLQDVLDWQSAEDELNLDAPLINTNSFFPPPIDDNVNLPLPTSTASPASPAAAATPSAPKPCPGFEIVLTSNIAPKNISSSIDKSHILHTKRCANLARAMAAFEIPCTYWEAMLSSNASSWMLAVNAELEAMKHLKVWTIELIPSNESLLGTVWVFHQKKDSNGVVVKFKARLCAQGSQQHDGYRLTYAPTGRSTSLRAAMLVGLSRGYAIHQMDAQNAFLNIILDKPIFLRPPPGLDVPKG